MKLMRRLTWCTAKYNFIVHSKFVYGKYNNIADAISRFQIDRFRRLCPTALPTPCFFPPHSEILWN